MAREREREGEGVRVYPAASLLRLNYLLREFVRLAAKAAAAMVLYRSKLIEGIRSNWNLFSGVPRRRRRRIF